MHPALGRCPGGLSTKIYMAVDGQGRPVRFILTGGQRNDITQAPALLAGFRPKCVLADKGYDSRQLVAQIHSLGAQPGSRLAAASNRVPTKRHSTDYAIASNVALPGSNRFAASPLASTASPPTSWLSSTSHRFPCGWGECRGGLAPHIPESQVDCGGHSKICGPRFPAANCPFPQEKRWTERQGTRTQANSQSRWPRFKHETVCQCRALSLPGRLPLARSAKALWRLSRDSPSVHHPEAAGQCSSCSVCSRRSTSGRAMA